MTIDAYPLCWPIGRQRTNQWSRETARFSTTFARARDDIVREVALLIGKNTRYMRADDVIISTNIPLRQDGLPYANFRKPDDPGVAVYFKYKGKQMCFACDRWKQIEDNMQAICKTIEALRGIARWGTGDMLEAAFTGFTALPAPSAKRGWREVLGVSGSVGRWDAQAAYRRMASQHHPDKGGSAEKMAEINAAWEEAQRELS
jgi:hypothetical protein